MHEENDHVIRFLNRRVCRGRRSGGLLWAVMDDDAAKFVEIQLALGEMHAALRSLEVYADYYGTMFPDSVDEPQPDYYAQVPV